MVKALGVFVVALGVAICACARLAWALLTDPALRSMLVRVWRSEIERCRRG